MRVFVHGADEQLRRGLDAAADELGAEVVDWTDRGVTEAKGAGPGPHVLIVGAGEVDDLRRLRLEARRAGAALVVACSSADQCRTAALARADDWLLLPGDETEIAMRIETARHRVSGVGHAQEVSDAADLIRYEELLYDRLTGFPTLPVMIEQARALLERRNELTILYIHFVRYSKIEEIYGWQKLDDVLETTSHAVRDFYAKEHGQRDRIMMVSHTGDDGFILFTHVPAEAEAARNRMSDLSDRLEGFVKERLEREHGEDIASLCGIYVGASTVFRNPKIRTERLIYRGLREAADAARSAEQWERTQKVDDLKATVNEGAVFIEYHPIIITQTGEVYGYEALARGIRRELRSPEVLFEVAAEANLVWELSRLLRKQAVAGIMPRLPADQLLFLNIDPHDFDDPAFRNMKPEDLGIDDPSRIVLEITERTAITDYPRFQEYLNRFREMGFRFAVDDAGSGYAGLGSIANLEPDFIKLDISLIGNIDSNFLKQHLVETMVGFAETHGAKVVAEGVEREEEFETVKQLGVHLTQGFLFHKPLYSKDVPR